MEVKVTLDLELRKAIRLNRLVAVKDWFEKNATSCLYDQVDCLASPLVYAVAWKRPDIVHYLVSHQSMRIPIPHDCSCFCDLCSKLKTDERFGQIYVRKILTTLVSPIYVCSLNEDPIDYYLEIFRRIQNIRHVLMKHSRSIFRGLRNTIENNIVDLLDCCDTDNEARALLIDDIDPTLAEAFDEYNPELGRLYFFMDLKLRKPLVHKTSQHWLTKVWMQELSITHTHSWLYNVKMYIIALFVFIISPIIVIFPHPKLIQLARARPIAACLEMLSTYTNVIVIVINVSLGVTDINAFLCSKASNLNESFARTINTFTILYCFIFSRICREVYDIFHIGYRRFYISLFDRCLSVSNAFQLAGLTTLAVWSYRAANLTTIDSVAIKAARKLCPANRSLLTGLELCTLDKHLTPPEIIYITQWTAPERIGSGLLTIGYLLVFLSLGSAFEWHKMTGVLTFTVQKMINDIGHFILVLLLVFIAWTSALTTHYQNFSCVVNGFSNFSTTANTLYWGIFDMSDISAYKIGSTPEAKASTVSFMETTGLILYGSYIIVSSIVAVNLLITIMSNSVEEIRKNKNDKWLFALSCRQMKMIVLRKYHSVFLPVPFNLLTPLLYCFKIPLDCLLNVLKPADTVADLQLEEDFDHSCDSLNKLSSVITRKAVVEKCLVKQRLEWKLCEFSKEAMKVNGQCTTSGELLDEAELLQEVLDMEDDDDDDEEE